jgi:hypothetical protein
MAHSMGQAKAHGHSHGDFGHGGHKTGSSIEHNQHGTHNSGFGPDVNPHSKAHAHGHTTKGEHGGMFSMGEGM